MSEVFYAIQLPNGKYYSASYLEGAPTVRTAMNFPNLEAVTKLMRARLNGGKTATGKPLPPIPSGSKLMPVECSVMAEPLFIF